MNTDFHTSRTPDTGSFGSMLSYGQGFFLENQAELELSLVESLIIELSKALKSLKARQAAHCSVKLWFQSLK